MVTVTLNNHHKANQIPDNNLHPKAKKKKGTENQKNNNKNSLI